ncbi:hypothetical protein [Micromonospora sp. KLBMP9576]|uniref:hypothetical protein n=1 Tax=Micromonospora sp. KLBMP9576 TaxID=3424769 RepID=UPI003D8CFF74
MTGPPTLAPSFCCASYSAFAAAQLPAGMRLVDQVRADPATAEVSDKLRAFAGDRRRRAARWS